MKIVITGPESTGKSTLCEALARHFKVDFVPEFSREYLEHRDGNYTQEDLTDIAKGQISSEDKYQQEHDSLIICDTSLEVIRVWSEWKYHSCDPFILAMAAARVPDLFLLLTPDLPWKSDPLRENPDDRNELFAYYQKSLRGYNTIVVEISGDADKRIKSAINAINAINEFNS